MKWSLVVLAAACVLSVLSTVSVSAEDKVLDFTLKDIDEKPYPLAQHKGEVLLIVNVASQCGFTPQYKGLEEIYKKYHDKGLTIIGVPANEFGAQEPGSNAEIKEFCSSKFHVTFPMMSKVVVKGDGICPLYEFLTTKGPKPGPISWNFNKYLVDRKGEVIHRFDSKVAPEDGALVEAIESALSAK